MNGIDQVLQRIFFVSVIGLATFTVHFLQSLNSQVSLLNEKMAVVLEKIMTHDERIHRLEDQAINRRRTP